MDRPAPTYSQPVVDPTPHIKWARSIARGVRADFGFLKGSQEEQELEAEAYLALCRKAHSFDPSRVPPGGDPAGAFRGYASSYIRCECRREARRLKNGGTYHTRNESGLQTIEVEDLPGWVHGREPGPN